MTRARFLMGTIFLVIGRAKRAPHRGVQSRFRVIGRAKRAPHRGVQSRFRVIYIYVSVVVQNAHAELRGQTRACSRSVWGG